MCAVFSAYADRQAGRILDGYEPADKQRMVDILLGPQKDFGSALRDWCVLNLHLQVQFDLFSNCP